MVTPIIQQGIDKGEFKEADASEIAITFGALLEGTILIWVYDSDLVDLEKNLRASIKLLMEGIIK